MSSLVSIEQPEDCSTETLSYDSADQSRFVLWELVEKVFFQ